MGLSTTSSGTRVRGPGPGPGPELRGPGGGGVEVEAERSVGGPGEPLASTSVAAGGSPDGPGGCVDHEASPQG